MRTFASPLSVAALGALGALALVRHSGAQGTRHVDVTSCGVTKGCMRIPPRCSTAECEVIVTWRAAEDLTTISFEISTNHQWGSVGFSDGKSMSADEVLDCRRKHDNDSVAEVGRSKNEIRTNIEVIDMSGIAIVETAMLDNYAICRFSRATKIVGPTDYESVDLLEKYYLLVARGSHGTSGKFYHTPPGRIFSDEKVSMLDFVVIDISSKPTLLMAHACLMIFAWAMCVSIGIMAARHMKDEWSESMWCGVKIWFVIHRTCMVTAFCATIAAFIIIFVHVKGFSDVQTWTPEPTKAHPYLGVIVTAAVVVNPIMSLFRPAPNHSNRPIFNWAHWAVGLTGYLLSIATIYLGLLSPTGKLIAPEYLTWIMTTHVVVWVGIDLLLEVERCVTASTNMINVSVNDEQGINENTRSNFKIIVFNLFAFVMISLSLTLIIAIASPN